MNAEIIVRLEQSFSRQEEVERFAKIVDLASLRMEELLRALAEIQVSQSDRLLHELELLTQKQSKYPLDELHASMRELLQVLRKVKP